MAAFTYTLADIRTAVRDLLNESTPAFWTDAELTAYINDGQREVAQFTGCVQNIDALATTGGTQTVSYTGNDIANIEYKPGTGIRRSLIQSDPLKVGHLPMDGVAPQYWWISKGLFGIDPVPDIAYNLDVYINDVIADFATDATACALPMAFRPLLIWYACYRAYQQEQNYGAAGMYHQIYQSEMLYLVQDNLSNVPDARSEMKYL